MSRHGGRKLSSNGSKSQALAPKTPTKKRGRDDNDPHGRRGERTEPNNKRFRTDSIFGSGRGSDRASTRYQGSTRSSNVGIYAPDPFWQYRTPYRPAINPGNIVWATHHIEVSGSPNTKGMSIYYVCPKDPEAVMLSKARPFVVLFANKYRFLALPFGTRGGHILQDADDLSMCMSFKNRLAKDSQWVSKTSKYISGEYIPKVGATSSKAHINLSRATTFEQPQDKYSIIGSVPATDMDLLKKRWKIVMGIDDETALTCAKNAVQELGEGELRELGRCLQERARELGANQSDTSESEAAPHECPHARKPRP